MPGARPHPQPRGQKRVERPTSVVTTGTPKRSGIPCAMVLRLLRALPGVPGFLATVACADRSRKLDPSVEGTGPHGLTVRERAARLAARPRPSHPAPRVVTIAKRPPSERGTASLNHNFCLSERGIFLRDALDSSGKTGGGFLGCAASRRNTPRVPGAAQCEALRRRPGTHIRAFMGPGSAAHRLDDARIAGAALHPGHETSGKRQGATTHAPGRCDRASSSRAAVSSVRDPAHRARRAGRAARAGCRPRRNPARCRRARAAWAERLAAEQLAAALDVCLRGTAARVISSAARTAARSR